ncbi:MAG: hypothetical protein QXD77_01445 [Candidatus Aenigmatarchaeota archaeon]
MNIIIAVIGIIVLVALAAAFFNFYTYGSVFGNDNKEYTLYIAAANNASAGATFYMDGKEIGRLDVGNFPVNVTGRLHELKAVKDGRELKRNISPNLIWIVDFEKGTIHGD